MEEFLSICSKRGFIWGPSPSIYGGVSGFYDYGPLGTLLKRNIENLLRREFFKEGFWEVECPTVAPEIVWRASGHVERFVDPLVKCKECGKEFRADKLLEEALNRTIATTNPQELAEMIRKHGVRCPECGGELNGVTLFNLMLRTEIFGGKVAYLRPETATMTYLLFPMLYQVMRKRLPFGAFQIGKAYRNEISPRKFVLRMREFTQAEAQLFILPEQEESFERFDHVKEKKLVIWSEKMQKSGEEPQEVVASELFEHLDSKSPAYAWCLWKAWEIAKKILPRAKMRFRQHAKEERAHYANDAWDLEVYSERFGWVEVCGVHDRSTYDLSRHSSFSGENLSVMGKIPKILEIAFGVDRLVYLCLETSFTTFKNTKGFAFPPYLAPVQVAVFPLVKKDAFVIKAKRIYEMLVNAGFVAIYDDSGSIGRRYARSEEIGIPYAVTVDGQTLEDDTVTVRDRDTAQQIRISISDLESFLRERLRLK